MFAKFYCLLQHIYKWRWEIAFPWTFYAQLNPDTLQRQIDALCFGDNQSVWGKNLSLPKLVERSLSRSANLKIQCTWNLLGDLLNMQHVWVSNRLTRGCTL